MPRFDNVRKRVQLFRVAAAPLTLYPLWEASAYQGGRVSALQRGEARPLLPLCSAGAAAVLKFAGPSAHGVSDPK